MDFSTITALLMGLGLAATAGFRVFVPLLIGALAVRSGMVVPVESFLWIGSTPALILFSAATLLEVAAYYVPWMDNLLDTVATPSAVVAGILLTASFIGESNEMFRWVVGIIGGGGVAGAVQGATVILRGGSTATTGGLANPLVSTFELFASAVGAVLALFAPVIVIFIILILVFLIIKRSYHLKKVQRA